MKEPHPKRGEGEEVWRGVRRFSMGEEKGWRRTEKRERKRSGVGVPP